MDWLTRALRGFAPAIPHPKPTEALRAAIGAGLGLLLTGALLHVISPTTSLLTHPLLIAPFAASAVLIFAVPNSPLAQPWAVVVGNTVAALSGLLCLYLLPVPLFAAALAVLLTLLATAALRATHPPAGAVAMAVVLASDAAPAPLTFALHPVLTGSLALVIAGIAWNHSTGRAYPFRQAVPAPHGTADAPSERRLQPSPEILAATLTKLRLGANVGVEDLARLITAAQVEAASATLGQITAAQIMSRDLITAAPQSTLADLATSFRTHRLKSLPICDEAGHYAGCVTIDAMVGLSDPKLTAHDLRDPGIQTATTDTPMTDLITLLSDGRQQTVPITNGPHLVGLVTRSDLLALLIHQQAAR